MTGFLAMLLSLSLQDREDQAAYSLDFVIDGATCEDCARNVKTGLERLRDRLGDVNASLREEKGTKTVVASMQLRERARLDIRAIQNAIAPYQLRTLRSTLRGYATVEGSKIQLRLRTSNQVFEIQRSTRREHEKVYDEMLRQARAGQIKFQVVGTAEAKGQDLLLTLESATAADFKDPKP